MLLVDGILDLITSVNDEQDIVVDPSADVDPPSQAELGHGVDPDERVAEELDEVVPSGLVRMHVGQLEIREVTCAEEEDLTSKESVRQEQVEIETEPVVPELLFPREAPVAEVLVWLGTGHEEDHKSFDQKERPVEDSQESHGWDIGPPLGNSNVPLIRVALIQQVVEDVPTLRAKLLETLAGLLNHFPVLLPLVLVGVVDVLSGVVGCLHDQRVQSTAQI